MHYAAAGFFLQVYLLNGTEKLNYLDKAEAHSIASVSLGGGDEAKELLIKITQLTRACHIIKIF